LIRISKTTTTKKTQKENEKINFNDRDKKQRIVRDFPLFKHSRPLVDQTFDEPHFSLDF